MYFLTSTRNFNYNSIIKNLILFLNLIFVRYVFFLQTIKHLPKLFYIEF